MELARQLESEFDAWKESPAGHDWIVWLGADPQTSSITLLLIVDDQKGGGASDESEEAEEIQLFYPVDQHSIWFMEPKRTQHLSSSSNVSVCPWADSLNEYLTTSSFDRGKRLSLSEVLDKVTELKYGGSIDPPKSDLQPNNDESNRFDPKPDEGFDEELHKLLLEGVPEELSKVISLLRENKMKLIPSLTR